MISFILACKACTVRGGNNGVGREVIPQGLEGDELCSIIHLADVMTMMTGLGIGMDDMHDEMAPKAVGILDIDRVGMSDLMTRILVSVEGTVWQMQCGE